MAAAIGNITDKKFLKKHLNVIFVQLGVIITTEVEKTLFSLSKSQPPLQAIDPQIKACGF